MGRLTRGLWAAVFALALVGCGDDSSGPSEADIEGTWSGDLGGAPMTLTITELDGDLAGSGTIQAGETHPLTLDGTVSGDEMEITITVEGFNPFVLTGTFTEESMSGVANGSGFDDEPFELSRD